MLLDAPSIMRDPTRFGSFFVRREGKSDLFGLKTLKM